MIAIKIGFPAGRWHATAWGSHVNEGVPEWPPCPWRLCRALIAAWHWKHRRDEPTLRGLIDKLAAAPAPDFLLPQASAAHTRHYMPVIEGPKESRTKVFDTFVQVSANESLWIRWAVDLTEAERTLVATLLESLSYLGRAESLIDATLTMEEDGPPEKARWTHPMEKSRMSEGEAIRLLVPQDPDVYVAWFRQQSAATANKKSKSKKKTAALPESIFQALQLDTADWKKEGWNLPPGAQWLEYLRPHDALKVAPRGAPTAAKQNARRTVVRFALVSKVPPSITEALSLGERFHQALCSRLPTGQSSRTLTGCDENRVRLTGNRHAYYLPECDAHGYVTHMTLYASDGFDDAACRAFGRLREVWGAEGFEVKVVLLAMGAAGDFASASPYFRSAKKWASLTPYIPVRHPKATRTGKPKVDAKTGLQVGSPAHDCWRLLDLVKRDLAPDLRVVNVSERAEPRIRCGLRDISCLDFQRNRKTGEGMRAGHRGYSLTIEFDRASPLPFGLGYGGHFGLGLFRPVDE